ncbi:exocyst complex component 8 isoform X2 [Drosophila pseudoobscura]|uniref:Exocyst complex component 8 n=1 Tax=Drosophila pseudoobscura pseudoobscura TaxID=46245 RepID=A0A6I8UQ72_DROPS|nr:exocyst complex component 8 isoform X2 [Drosophila pseudoobscura]
MIFCVSLRMAPAAPNMKEFDDFNFSVDKYTKELTRECVGGSDLQQRKKEIEAYNETTAATLKQTCKKNYMEFIQTAKEISHLESEMYQLSHILIEQRNILATMTDGKTNSRLKADSVEAESSAAADDVQNSHATRAVKEMVQGFNGNLEGKTFLNEGALIELDANDYRPIQRVFFFLFNDVLIVCKVKHDKRLDFLTEYDPKKIGVINIKDLDGVKNAINIITPDGSKIYQSITAAGKTEWIEKLEEAFRFDQQKKSKKGQAPQPPTRAKQQSSKSSTPEKVSSTPQPETPTEPKSLEDETPEWLSTASEEIQTLVAQRHFEEAQELIKRTQEYVKGENRKKVPQADSIESKVKQQELKLINVLLKELSNSHNRNLQIALRSAKRPLKILVEMGRYRQASATLLKVCAVSLRVSQREARRNNADISELFFCDLTQVACDYLTAFEQQPACVSALVVWCNAELQYFASQLIKHYLAKGTSLETVAKCVERVRKPSTKLTEIGLDISYHLEGLLRTTLESLIEESKERLLDSVGRTEESWQPYNLQTKSNLKRLLLELDVLGIDVRAQATGDTWMNLTQSTVVFIRHFLQLTEHCGCLAKCETLLQKLELLLKELFIAHHSLKPPSDMAVDPNFVMKNKIFLVDNLLPIAIDKFRQISGRQCEILRELHTKMSRQHGAPLPRQRSVYTTDVF